jgi:hypothetical protein
MLLRRLLRVLLEPARDPLHDSLAASLGRVAELRARLDRQIRALHTRTCGLRDAALEAEIHRLEAEQARLLDAERRLVAECETWRARRDLLSIQQTAATARSQLGELIEALDAAQARAAALAELSAQ